MATPEVMALVFHARPCQPGKSMGNTELYNRVDQYAASTGAAWMLVHHATKGAQNEKRVTDVGSGSGSQSRAADTHIVLRDHQEQGQSDA